MSGDQDRSDPPTSAQTRHRRAGVLFARIREGRPRQGQRRLSRLR